jgi:hypothetical protein
LGAATVNALPVHAVDLEEEEEEEEEFEHWMRVSGGIFRSEQRCEDKATPHSP